MKLITLKFKNFRQFYGEQEVHFSTDPKKNVTLIHAENGVGKTAFLNAIKWCLYKDTTSNFRDDKNLLNNHAKSEGELDYSVVVKFEENDAIYECIRGKDSRGSDYFKLFKEDPYHGYQPIDEPDLVINSILPKDMSKYFFFQGEGVDSYSKVSSGSNSRVKEAIHNILGFRVALSALEDLRIIKKEYQDEIKKRNKGTELEKKYNELKVLEENEQKLSALISQYMENIEDAKARIDEIDEKMRNSSVESVKNAQQRRDQLESEINNINTGIRKNIEKKKEYISDYGASAFSFKLATQALDFINDEEFKGTIPAPYNENLVNELLEKTECICGAEIKEGTSAYENIKKLLENAADPIQGSRVIRARETLKAIRNDNKRAAKRYKEINVESSLLHKELDEKKLELKKISESFTEEQEVQISSVENKRKSLERSRDLSLEQKGRAERDLEQVKKKISEVNLQIRDLNLLSGGLSELQQSEKIISHLEEELKNVLERTENSSFVRLSSLINETLEKYAKQDYRAKIDKKFNIHLIDREGDRVAGESDGQQLLLSLTFISSLIKLAALRKDSEGEILTSGVVAPFVIDAPFGVLDNSYKGSMAESIPESVEQVVFLLSSSHWEGSVENSLRERVGKEYNFVMEVNAPQGEKELNPLTICGNKIDTVRYDCSIDRTVIEEVIV